MDVDCPHVGEVRSTKLARSLQTAGHEVVFISTLEHGEIAAAAVRASP
jgi:UDP:flavonoid glycosyltransferase YjiC (YdhE family)